MWEQDQTDLPNERLTGIFRRPLRCYSVRAFLVSEPVMSFTELTSTMNTIQISRRQKSCGDNHHLWNNHGTWWLHCTIHLPDFTKSRLRKNLRTSDVRTARQLRDRILADNSTALAA